jgi:hypothetical protein
MLTIRHAQFAAMLDARLPEIGTTLLPYMRERHRAATAGLNDAELRERIICALVRARSWGFESMFGLTSFVALMFDVAPDFDTDPAIRAALRDSAKPLDARIAGIGDALSEAGWAQVAQRADQGAWKGVTDAHFGQ